MSWLNGVIGQGIAANLGGTGHMAQQNAAQASQYGGLANVGNFCHHQPAQQQAMAAQQAYNVGMTGMSQGSYQGISQPMRWMIDGVMLEFKDFVDIVFPDDTAEKTMFVLKYSKGEDK